MSLDLSLSFDSLARVDGSARFGFGQYPQFLTSISGPIEVRLAAEQPSQTTIEVFVRPLTNVPGTESKAASTILKEIIQTQVIMEANPRTLVQFVVQALVPMSSSKFSDELMAAMINSCTLSLLNAGSVPMRGVICAVLVGQVSSAEDEAAYIVQPTEAQASRMDAGGCFAFLFSNSSSGSLESSCVWTNWRSLRQRSSGSAVEKGLVSGREVARDAAREVWERMKSLVEERETPKSSSLKISAKTVKPKKMDVEKEDDDDAKMEI
ncbi:hypothetical protein GYMLUDRAFT_48554 [Collybiopsis luxurians FD-317 M1]|uniref:Exoribonuclease phosphorolytic domain-containing protein n=1 Tax=Collybiopsis luxurians FD-317 M1 TaxID=944289 RepID=A0A0D0C9J2_9AGAR|nr:hypothetical protein GYMLUDRAFT_48554 [Collybiopsis luxurians FD-317 M1]